MLIRNLCISLSVFITLICNSATFADQTPWLKMDRFQVDHVTGDIAVFRNAGWQLPSCSSARVIWFKPVTNGVKNLGHEATYAAIMLAFSSEQTILFHADCDTNPDWAIGTYAISEYSPST